MSIRVRVTSAAILAMLLAACSSDGSAVESTPSISTSVEPAPSTPPATAAPEVDAEPVSTDPPDTAVAATDEAVETAPPSTAACSAEGGTDARTSGDEPFKISTLVGTDIQTNALPCFEEVVIRLSSATDPDDFPGWTAEYVTQPVPATSEAAFTVQGGAALVVRIGVRMPAADAGGYDGPVDLVPTNVTHILQLRNFDNVEGATSWAIGVDELRPFTVTVPDGPPRLVIRFAV